ncbi:MAG: hypothetical protein AB2L20_22360 [Mangrovibacterium sp.]
MEKVNICVKQPLSDALLFQEGTPLFMSGKHKFPSQYELNDLKQFTDEFRTLTLESKRQEAHVNLNPPLPARTFPLQRKEVR